MHQYLQGSAAFASLSYLAKNVVARGLVGPALFRSILLHELGAMPKTWVSDTYESFSQNLKRPKTLRRAGFFEEPVLALWQSCTSRRADFANFV